MGLKRFLLYFMKINSSRILFEAKLQLNLLIGNRNLQKKKEKKEKEKRDQLKNKII